MSAPARRRLIVAAGAALLVAALAADLLRPPGRQLTARTALAAIRLYRVTASPWAGSVGARCRFHPTCSVYAERVIAEHGTLRGGALTLRRLARCGPWTPAGTPDPPPLAPPTPPP